MFVFVVCVRIICYYNLLPLIILFDKIFFEFLLLLLKNENVLEIGFSLRIIIAVLLQSLRIIFPKEC